MIFTESDLSQIVFYCTAFKDDLSRIYSTNSKVSRRVNQLPPYGPWYYMPNTIYHSYTTNLVLTDTNTLPTIRIISPKTLKATIGKIPDTWDGIGTTNYNKVGDGNSSLGPYSIPANFTTTFQAIMRDSSSFSKGINTTLANTIFSSSFATTLLNSIKTLITSGKLENYLLNTVGVLAGTSLNTNKLTSGNWCECMFSMMPIVDIIISNYAKTNNLTKINVINSLFPNGNYSDLNIFVWNTCSECRPYTASSGTYDFRSIFFATEISPLPSSFRNIQYYNYLKEFPKLSIRSYEVVYNTGITNYDTAKSLLRYIN